MKFQKKNKAGINNYRKINHENKIQNTNRIKTPWKKFKVPEKMGQHFLILTSNFEETSEILLF